MIRPDSWWGFLVLVAAAVVTAVVLTVVLAATLRLVGRKHDWPRRLIKHARLPFRVFLLVMLLWAAFAVSNPAPEWRAGLDHLFLILAIASGAWFAGGLLTFFESMWLSRYRTDVRDNRVARRVRTQILILRRLTVAVVVVVALAAILLTFPGARAAGASLLASAGLLSIVAGLAAQSTLANVFAGVQLAFSGAIRVDDVVIVEEEWGRIEEITLTYVVVHIWDDRRLVLPSTYFTSTPFENWTRTSSELLGSVEFDLDWRVTPQEMREELDRILERTELWDGRVKVLQVTDATGGYVRVRVLVTAIDAPTLFDLRCFIREELVAWLHTKSPDAIPRTRVQMVEAEQPQPKGRTRRSPAQPSTDTAPSALFHGTAGAEERASQFTGPIQTISKQQEPPLDDGFERDRGRGDSAN
ncbi:mechanosensitive ion channel family protein [Herbiconiux sp. SYSU D00978]|uniref:mechanosensitive ion channel family protein n=1 Tax=Herbiconiux sp. SYSU D00978 TaxID=2812562 RepID=UPI001A95CF17|nr:mechanosensitive ion channel domain-containing protein [Herbiconiux sp. SYSU D00978]